MSLVDLGTGPTDFNPNFGIYWTDSVAGDVVRGDVMFVFVAVGFEADPIVLSPPLASFVSTVIESREMDFDNTRQVITLANSLTFTYLKTQPVLVGV